ncbi:hypothetical protein HOD75_01710 [archaeon]|jgi:hypothetical protein|nr:hypothetical protein [archaeon]MBT4241593.1 hypothetical protein [archaeon]MBT4417988.1 hypothetical protein [archaeon]
MSDLNNLIKNFFLKLKCNVSGNEIIDITNVPEKFEKLYGKNAPYRFTFDENLEDNNTELITSSSHLLKIISEYLKNKANTTILQLDFNEEIKDELIKNIGLEDFKIVKIDKKINFDYIFKLSFETTLQYLNENEKIINNIYIHDNEVIDNFKIEDYNTIQGNKKDLKIKDLKPEIKIAKSVINELLKPRIATLSYKLGDSLKQGIERINSHYEERVKETNQHLKTNNTKIETLKKDSISDPETIKRKIQRVEETIQRLKDKLDPAEVEKEKEFHLNDEKHKHTLSISSTLLNKTIIYYPIYQLRVFLKSPKQVRQISLQLNPLTKKISNLLCEACEKEIRTIELCSSNHLICKSCSKDCLNCGTHTCKKCDKNKCTSCNRQICNNCKTQCNKCKNIFCQEHITKDYLTNKPICLNCSTTCQKCHKTSDKTHFKKKNNKLLCPKCYVKTINPLKDYEF